MDNFCRQGSGLSAGRYSLTRKFRLALLTVCIHPTGISVFRCSVSVMFARVDGAAIPSTQMKPDTRMHAGLYTLALSKPAR